MVFVRSRYFRHIPILSSWKEMDISIMFTSSNSHAWITLENQSLFWSATMPLTPETLLRCQIVKSQYIIVIHNEKFYFEIEFVDELQHKKFFDHLAIAPHSITIK